MTFLYEEGQEHFTQSMASRVKSFGSFGKEQLRSPAKMEF